MRVHFTRPGWEDYLHWQHAELGIAGGINDLIEDVRRTPFKGLGKPEPLRANWHGWWSRRITGDHRLIYAVHESGDDQRMTIAQCR